MLAEALAIEADQHLAMAVLLVGHLLEDLGGRGVVVAQALDEVAVDAGVLLLVLDGKGENLAIAEVGEGALGRKGEEGHGRSIRSWRRWAIMRECGPPTSAERV